MRVAWVWVVWPTVVSTLPPLQYASGGPASQWSSTPAASVRMSGGQELINALRSITDMGGTAWLRVRGD